MPQPLTQFATPLTLIGSGNMAGAMLKRWLDEGLDPSLVTVVRPSGAAIAPGVRVTTSLDDIPLLGGIVMLGFKPQQLSEIAEKLARAIDESKQDTRVVSILAGVTLADLAGYFSRHKLVRAMPNMPVRSGHGVILLAGEKDAAVARLMAPLGHSQWLADETSFDLYTALAGCGPAFVYRYMEALAAAGTRLGLPADEADTLTRVMMLGAVASATHSARSPGELAAEVASKGGMTQAGLDILDEDGRLVGLLTDMLRAARDRGKELADLARPE